MKAKQSLLWLLVALALFASACGSGSDSASDDNGGETTTEETDGGSDDGGDADTADAADEGDSDGGGEEASGDGGGNGDALRVLVHQNPPMVEYMETFNEKFTADTGIDVDMSIVKADDLTTANQTRLTAGDVDVTTITVAGFANPVQDYMTGAEPPAWQQLIDAGLVYDMSNESFVSNYDDAAIADGGSYNGKVYSVNLGRVSYSGMFVNKDLLAEVGVEIPTTWSELVDVCAAVKDAGNACMTAGGQDGWPIFVGSYGILGATYPDQQAYVEGLWTGTAKWNDEKGLELMSKYQTYAQDFLEEGVTGLTHDAAIARYAAGDVAFAPTGVWQAPALEDAGAEFDWTYIPFPGSDNAEDNQYLFGKYDQGWAIAADSPNLEASIKYLEAFSEPENYNAFANAVGFIPTQPTATLDSKLGEAVAPYLENYRVGYEQWWIDPSGTGQWGNGAQAPSWFAPFNEWTDSAELANQVQADLDTGLGAEG